MSDYDAAFAAAVGGPAESPYDSIMKSLMAQHAPTQVPDTSPTATQAGAAINNASDSIPRQLGLTARYGLEGLANAAQLGTEPIRYVTDRLTGQTGKTKPLGAVATQLADWLGLPSPQGANERVIGDATRLVAGAGGLGGAASLAKNAPGAVGQMASMLSSNMPQQLGSAAGAGLAGGASREGGGNGLMQGVAALGGGIAGGLAPSAISGTATAVKSMFNRMTPQQMDAEISAVLNQSGVDYSQVPERVKQSLRQQMGSALQAGKELDPAAVARLTDFTTVGAIPTRGMVSQNPVQITREMNLAKIGANSADDGLSGLAMVQNSNNKTLIRNLNDAGAAKGDPFVAGQSAIGAINAKDSALESGVSSLYKQARDTSGRAADLDRQAFATRVSDLLDEAMVGGALPSDVQNKINWIASNAKPQGMHGSIPMPFNVDIAEQLKTQIAKLQRSTNDGSARHALGLVRQALDETPLMPSPSVNPGNLPAVPGTVPPSAQTVGQESIDAFNAARNAARQRFGWQESAKPIEAALNGAQPDKFVQQYVIGGSLADAKAIAENAPIDQVKNAILAHLKEKAIGAGATDEVGKFSQSNFNRALSQIGDRKLKLFFSPEELAQIKSVARVASYMQNQPVGSAVNNSNSGALVLGKGIDALAGFSNSIPMFGPLVSQPLVNGIKGLNVTLRTNQAQNVLPGLLANSPKHPLSQGLLLPALAYGGTLAAP